METKKLTEKEALEETIKQWTWLSKHPNKDKYDYFLEKGFLWEDIPQSANYCCEFAHINFGTPLCTHCPVWKGAWHSNKGGCHSPYSPYEEWHTHYWDEHKRATNAQIIVKMAKEKLAELEDKEND